ncbi:hypothetical protein [Ruminococcus difficilis]|uniref:Uncharacterized protein n=1 Tax=Ruminococcus difficilis TaxID=2763069 RepID=A0A934U1K4_9FIRM|nr:hypothetical protein [Ruminococcus difficilis]MBK6087614.1 hypothetical protein [Ruminococcus difficilis]
MTISSSHRQTMIDKLAKKALVIAIVFAVLTILLCIVINNFQFYYSTNDDYTISSILAKGENGSLYINYLFTSFLCVIYRFIPSVNWFVVIQIVLNTFGLICINYVMIKRFNRLLAIGFILSYSILFINQAVSIIQWTQTATIQITAGFLLLFYALLWNRKGSWSALQMVTSAALVLLGTLVRFSSLYPVLIIFVASLILWRFVTILKGNKKNYKDIIRKACKDVLIIVLICCICFLSNVLSNSLAFSDKEWQDYRKYNHARSNVVDYYHAPYEGNEEFYNSIGIYSENDLKVGVFSTDNTFFSTSKLNSISEYSKSAGYGNRFIITEFLSKLSGIRIYFMLGLCVVLVGLAIVLLKFRNKIKPIFPILLIALFIAYFIVFKFDYTFILALPILTYILVTGFVCNRYHFICLSVLSVLCLSLIVVMNFIRLNFRVAFNIFFPTIILLYCFFDIENIRNNLNKDNAIKRFGAIGFAIVLVVNFYTCAVISGAEQNRINEHTDVSEYISSNEGTLFVSEKVEICPKYNTPLISPYPRHDNLISFGWKVGSPEYQSILKQYNAVNLFQAMVDNPRIKIIIKDTEKTVYENYFNSHYNDKVVFIKEEDFNGVSVFAVCTREE